MHCPASHVKDDWKLKTANSMVSGHTLLHLVTYTPAGLKSSVGSLKNKICERQLKTVSHRSTTNQLPRRARISKVYEPGTLTTDAQCLDSSFLNECFVRNSTFSLDCLKILQLIFSHPQIKWVLTVQDSWRFLRKSDFRATTLSLQHNGST
jgi:hypothetical protein